MNRNADVEAYVLAAPSEHRELLQWLRTRIRRAVPHCEEVFEARMPVYKHGDKWVTGFAWRKKGVMFYCMNSALLDGMAQRIGKARSGKSCIEMTATREHPLEELRAIVTGVLAAVQAAAGDSS